MKQATGSYHVNMTFPMGLLVQSLENVICGSNLSCSI